MITISISELAELKNCSEQHLRKKVLSGEIIAITEYYKKHGMEVPAALVKKKSKAERSKDIESYSATQRDEMVVWSGIIKEWDRYCIGKPSKTQATKDFALVASEKYPNLKISQKKGYGTVRNMWSG